MIPGSCFRRLVSVPSKLVPVDLQARGDPTEKAVKMLAKKEVLLFAATVRSRICRGKPNKEFNKDTQTFAKTVDNNVRAFQPYVDMTGMWCVYVLARCARHVH